MHTDYLAKNLSRETMEMIEKVHIEKISVTGIPTGFTRFDEMTGGLHKSEFVILAGCPGLGKTALALNIAYYLVIEKKIPVGIFSLQNNRHTLFERMICSASKTNLHDVHRGMFRREKWNDMIKEFSKLSESLFWIDDTLGLTCKDIRMRTSKLIARLKKKEKKMLGLIIIDNIQLIQSENKYSNRVRELADITKQLKNMATKLDIPVLTTSEINYPEKNNWGWDYAPQISALRESGMTDEYADLVTFIHRPEYFRRDDESLKGIANLIIAKQRIGPIGTIDLTFEHEYTHFKNPHAKTIA